MDPKIHQSTVKTTVTSKTTEEMPSNSQKSVLPTSQSRSQSSLPIPLTQSTLPTALPQQSNLPIPLTQSNYPMLNSQSGYPLNQQIGFPNQQFNQGTITKTVITQKTRDFNTWSDKELKLELKKYGERVPKHTERAELIRRLNVHEKPIQTIHQGQFPHSQGINSNIILVTEVTRDYKDFSDRNLRKALKKFGDRVPRNTERAELIRRLNIHEKPVQTTISAPVSQGLTGITGVPLEIPIGLPTQQVPNEFQSGIPIQHGLHPHHHHHHQMGVPLNQSGIPMQQSGIPMQQSGIPIQQSGIPMQQSGIPMQQSGIPIQQSGLPIQQTTVPNQTVTSVPIQQSFPHNQTIHHTGTNLN